MEQPTFTRFRALCRDGNVVPVWREIPADCLTPVLAYLGAAKDKKRSFLLESIEGGERVGRYSFIGRDPWLTLAARGDVIEEQEGRNKRSARGDFLDRLREIQQNLEPVVVEGLPPFTGGAVGYIAYDAIRRFEPVLETSMVFSKQEKPVLPDAWFGLYDTVLAFDHIHQSILLIASVFTDREGARGRTTKMQYETAQTRLDKLASDVARGSRVRIPRQTKKPGKPRPARSNLTKESYRRMVQSAKRYIKNGDLYQVVLSQRFRRRLSGDAFGVYRALRRINPSPYMYFLRDGVTSLAGASPEMLVRVEGSHVDLHPIAGTRPRGDTPEEDAALEKELRSDEKEKAEHVMLVDLGRNDLGRVCGPGRVRVPEFMQVEKYSHVMHLVSRVTGTLAEGKDAFDALKAAFPAGTVSGAPKIRSMEVIDELEPVRRGAYAGVVCYIDHAGNLDSCITIRTMVANGRDAIVQAGSGIVADSDADNEYTESVNKAKAVLKAIDEASTWLP